MAFVSKSVVGRIVQAPETDLECLMSSLSAGQEQTRGVAHLVWMTKTIALVWRITLGNSHILLIPI
jgi:hypothetical protein